MNIKSIAIAAACHLVVAATVSAGTSAQIQRPGLTVVIGMPDAALISALSKREDGLTQILLQRERNRSEVPVRQGILNEPNGRFTIMDFKGPHTPYAENMVNTVYIIDEGLVSQKELTRILAPNGVIIQADGTEITKPWPKEMSEWNHMLYGAGNNAVAQDTLVGPPQRVQWIGAPDHVRHHNTQATFSAMVSAQGRLFTIIDKATLVTPYLPPEWVLVARDAFNGITLWEVPINDWIPNLRNFRSGPSELGRRLVAVDDEVFVTLGLDAPVSVIDAASGRIRAVLPGTEGAEEILVTDKYILVTAGSPRAQLKDWSASLRDYATGAKYKRALIVIDKKTRKIKWQKRDADTAFILPMSLTAGNSRVFYVNEKGLNALDISTGKRLWLAEEPVAIQRTAKFGLTMVAHQDVVLYADRVATQKEADAFYASRPQKYRARYRQLKAFPGLLRAYDAKTGRKLWEVPAGESFHTPTDVFVINDTVWYTTTPAMLEGNYIDGRDLRSGKVIKRIGDAEDINHGRCYRNRSTVKYLLGGTHGLDFIDPEQKENRWVSLGLRGTCQLGVLPCNGLLYMPPHACNCESDRKMLGYFALAPALSRTYPDPQQFQPRFHQGPAFDTGEDQEFLVSAQEWPTFRHDMQRSGTSSTSVPDTLNVLWTTHIGTRPTASVCAGGMLYVAARDDHVLYALDAESGDEIWRYQTGGRIDSPPTIAKGLAVFGCADGWVRCVRAQDGVLVWRYRAAHEERQIVVKGRLESVWPLHGSTLVKDGNVYCAAGRSSIIDGGISVFCLDLVSGKVLHRASCKQKVLREIPEHFGMGKPLPSDALLEVMSADKNNIYVRHLAFDPDLKSAKETANHLITTTGFVDDDYFHRGYWSWSHNLNRYRTAWVRAAGFIMAIDGQKAYAYARKREYYIGHIKGFERHLCSMDLIPKQEPLHKEPGTTPSQGRYSRMIGKYIEKGVKLHWSDDIPILVKAMTVAHDKLIVSGPAFSLNPSAFLVDESTDDILLGTALSNRSAASEVITKADKGLKGEIPPRLMIYDKNSGEQRFSMELESIPVFDGMIAASGKLYIGLEDGTVVCMGN